MRKRKVEALPIRKMRYTGNKKFLAHFSIEGVMPEHGNQGLTVPAHRHDFYHITYIKEGYGKHTIDFKTYDIVPNSLFFISPGQVHSIKLDQLKEGYVVSFTAAFFALNNSLEKLIDFPFFHSLNNAPVIYLDENRTDIERVFEEIKAELDSNQEEKEKIIKSLFEVFLLRASRSYQSGISKESPSHLTYQLRKLEALIDEHFREHKALADYADMMHISPKHLTSITKKGLDKTVTRLIHERTLLEAKRLLLFTDNSVSEVAFELGFSDKSYFMRFFKKHTSMTADTYRSSGQSHPA